MAMRSGCMRKMCRGSTKPRCSQQGNVFSQLRQQLQFHPRWHHCKPETSMRYQHQSVLTNNRRCTTLDSTLHSRVPRNMRSAPNPVQDPQDIFRQAKTKLGWLPVPLISTVFNFNPHLCNLLDSSGGSWIGGAKLPHSSRSAWISNLDTFEKPENVSDQQQHRTFCWPFFFAQGTQFVELLAVAFWPPRTLL